MIVRTDRQKTPTWTMNQKMLGTYTVTYAEEEYDDGLGKNVEHVEDNMPFICICQKVTPSTSNTATQTHHQNMGQPIETNQRIPCKPERQIMKQKTLLAKNTHTIKKLEHSLNVKILQLDGLQKQRTELKTELNLRWRELTTRRATHNNDKRKLQESEARLQESIKTNRWCTRTKHDFFNLSINPPMTIRLSYRQTLSNEHILVQTCRNDIADYGKTSNLSNLQLIMGRNKIEVIVRRVVKNFGTRHTVLTVENEKKTIQNLMVVN